MKTIYSSIKKQVTRFLRFSTAAALFCLVLSVPVVGQEQSARRNPELNDGDAVLGTAQSRAVCLGPGRVVFRVTAAGEWLGLVPGWSDGKDVITGGGMVVLATGDDGEVVELANTAEGRARACENSGLGGVVHEGADCGARYPLANSDDDRDGYEDEDRLDGIDNDEDGRIDEDFAAVGDEMVTLSFDVRDGENRPVLAFHQEFYAWSLPHLDGMIATQLIVKNVSDAPLNNVRIGAVIYKPGDYTVETQVLGANAGDKLAAKGVLLRDSGETAVAALFFAPPVGGADEKSWLTGVAGKNRSLASLLQAATYPDALSKAGAEPSVPSPQDDPLTDGAVENAPDSAGEDADRVTYGISPSFGNLNPGEQAYVYAALVAVPSMDRVSRAIEDAYRTVVGDGSHRMIPPPMSITSRTIWGTYRIDTGDDARPAVALTLENLGGLGIAPDDITYMAGVDLTGAVSKETLDGNLSIILPGDPGDKFSNPGSRVVLHGRLRGGEFFDLVLRPDKLGAQAYPLSEQDAETYWSSPGKLDEALLTGSPNPFRESTTIFYEVPAKVADENSDGLEFVNPIQTSVKIYNVAGRLVNVLVDAVLSPGIYDTSWDGTDDNGHGVASGVYYVKLQIGKKHVTKRLIQLK